TLEAMGKDQKTASILGWVSLGTGLAGSVLEIGASLTSGAMKAGKVGRGTQIQRAPGKKSTLNKSYEILYEENKGTRDVVFHKKAFKGKYAAIETHGDRGGFLMNSNGEMVPADVFARDELAPRLNQLSDYASDPNKPVVLLACRAGSMGAAQTVSSTLRRPVIAYAQPIRVPGPSEIRRLSLNNDSIIEAMTLSPSRTSPQMYVRATPRLYNPPPPHPLLSYGAYR
ncbi:hypothetical protein, partial [Pseudomonas sp. NPDC089406]|uniref:hypothetical protein n=1 Tax=Pseudomonas sp. NPDC089406 TaxID=3364463 RepID=UPI00384F2254